MIRRVVSTSLHQPLVLVMMLALFIAAGVAAFRSLPIEAFPDVTDVQVTVISLYSGWMPLFMPRSMWAVVRKKRGRIIGSPCRR